MRQLWMPLLAAVAGLGSAAGGLRAQSAPSGVPGDAPRTIAVGATSRTYLLHIPSTYHAGHPTPLVLVFHGGGGHAAGIAPHTGFSRLADRAGFVVDKQGIVRFKHVEPKPGEWSGTAGELEALRQIQR